MTEQQTDNTLNDTEKVTLRLQLVEKAKLLLGIPYEFGAEWNPFSIMPKALDNEEMIEGIFNLCHLKMPEGIGAQFTYTIPTPSPKFGDLVFLGKGGQVIESQIYHVGMLYDGINIVECRAYDPTASFKTGCVVLNSKEKWEQNKNFIGYRKHIRL